MLDQIISWLVVGLIVFISIRLFKQGEHAKAFYGMCLSFLVFLGLIFTRNLFIPSLEQVVCWAFGIGTFYLAFRFLQKDKHAEALVVFGCAFGMMICGLTAVQGLLKTGVLSKVNQSLVDYSNKLDGFQNDIEAARSEIKKQQNNITNQYSAIASLEDKLKIAQSNINTQFQTNILLQTELLNNQRNLAIQQAKLANIEFQVDHLFELTTTEVFKGSDSNVIYMEKDFDNFTYVFFKLGNTAMPHSVKGWQLTESGVEIVMAPLANVDNIAFGKFIPSVDINVLRGTTFTLEYVKNTRNTNSLSNIKLTNGVLWLLGDSFPLFKPQPRTNQ